MEDNDKPVLVYATFPSTTAAEALAEAVVGQGLAACANIIPGMMSVYVWDGTLQREQEVVMLLKTRAGLADRLIGAAVAMHPYDTPAFLVIPVTGGAQPFLDWVNEQTAIDR